MKGPNKIYINPIHRDLLLVVMIAMASAAAFVAAGFMMVNQL